MLRFNWLVFISRFEKEKSMTIDSKDIIKTLLENDGVYPGDPQMYSIHRYTNFAGNKTYHVSEDKSAEFAMYDSPYVSNPILLWSKEEGLTAEGKALIKD